MDSYHIPVLLTEVLEGLRISKGRKYIDATFGGGGHTKAILDRGGIVLGIDSDLDSIENAKQSFGKEIEEKRLLIVQGNFRDIDSVAKENGFEKVAGVLFDFGISSHQIDTPERGFSFQKEGPLDMRMDQRLGVTAADLLNSLSKKELAKIFFQFGQEPKSNQIAQEIVKRREDKKFETTSDLVSALEAVMPKRFGQINPATKIFQALRIVVNDELGSIETALPEAFGLLENGGRLAVISFHSLEDRVVKHYFGGLERAGQALLITEKPVGSSEREQEENPRSRSAKLRILEKR